MHAAGARRVLVACGEHSGGALHARQGARCHAAQDRGERAKAVAAELADELEAARDEAQRLDADRRARPASPARPP